MGRKVEFAKVRLDSPDCAAKVMGGQSLDTTRDGQIMPARVARQTSL